MVKYLQTEKKIDKIPSKTNERLSKNNKKYSK